MHYTYSIYTVYMYYIYRVHIVYINYLYIHRITTYSLVFNSLNEACYKKNNLPYWQIFFKLKKKLCKKINEELF